MATGQPEDINNSGHTKGLKSDFLPFLVEGVGGGFIIFANKGEGFVLNGQNNANVTHGQPLTVACDLNPVVGQLYVALCV